ncbi:MAG TPA: flagellar motor protein MotB [Rhodopseudomonas sp.]|uniref:flagellar motor protein MotB n=1 Tax=Rhodopseudomonas sp. TaxID=1078 RepID=UPI002ED99D28
MALRRPGNRKKKPEEATGSHVGGWFVTFADLMGLMTSFFVMLVSFSNQDQHKLQIVAGSMRDAFGVQMDARWSGVIETDGLPTRGKVKNVEHIAPDQATNQPSPDEGGGMAKLGTQLKADREFALASASLRQALQDMPEISEISKNVMFEDTPQGLNLQIVDQEGRPMFPDGSPLPYERTMLLVRKLAAPLRATALRVSIVGHTAAAAARDDDDAFVLSWQRANAVRQILKGEGLPSSHVFAVAGKADSEPLFPDAPLLAANRRVTITLMRENTAMPPGLKP